MAIFEALVECHDILIVGKSPIKLRHRPLMTIAVDWEVKHQFKQTNKQKDFQFAVVHLASCSIQINLIITLSLESTETYCVLSESML